MEEAKKETKKEEQVQKVDSAPQGKKIPNWLLIAACLSFAPLLNTAGLILPVLGVMQESFAAAGDVYPDWLVQFIQTSLMLSAFIMGMIFGPTSKKFSLRTLGIAGIAIAMVCNVIPGLFPQGGLWLFVFMRFLSGFGIGMVYGCNTSCIVANFPPEKRARMIALSVTVMQASTIIYSFAAGWLGSISWRLNFIAMLIFIIPLAFVTLGLPKTTKAETQAKKEKIRLSGSCIFVIIASLVYMFIAGSFNMGVAQQIGKLGIGGPVEAGNLLAVAAVAGLLISLVWANIRKILGRFAFLLVALIGLAAYLIAANAADMTMLYVACILVGIECAAGMAEANTAISEVAGPAATPTAIGLFNGLSRIFGFFLPVILAGIQAIFGMEGPGAYMMSTVPIWGVLVVLVIIYALRVYKEPVAE